MTLADMDEGKTRNGIRRSIGTQEKPLCTEEILSGIQEAPLSTQEKILMMLKSEPTLTTSEVANRLALLAMG